MKNHNCLVYVFVALFSTGMSEDATIAQSVVQAGFRELASFQVTKATLLKLGESTEIKKGQIIFRTFTDGIDIRICPEGKEEDYLSFQIYRNGSIYDETGENLRPGVQAFSDQGGVVRHLCIEPRLMTLTKFPTSSSDLEVIYATRYEH